MLYTRKLELNLINLPSSYTLLMDYESIKTLWRVIQQNLSKILRSKTIASAIPFVVMYDAQGRNKSSESVLSLSKARVQPKHFLRRERKEVCNPVSQT